MTKARIFPTVCLLLAMSAHAGKPPTILVQLTDEAVAEIAAVLVEDVQTISDPRTEASVTASLITVYTGPIVAPFTTYLKIFDLVPQNGGDYGTFKVFKIPHMMNDMPKQTKIQFAKNGKAIYVGFGANYLDTFDENGNAKYRKARMITKFLIANPTSEGAVAKEAEFTIRDK